jgi:mannitol/fructose-specific phosphotransferase system IIA component (Ntr-type)
MNQPQKLNKILPEIVKMIMKEKILKMLRTIKNHLLNSILKNNMNYN